LAGEWGKPLFEIRPDLFPEGFLTDAEMEIWALYYDEKSKRLEATRG
jgi:hypothetical protein